MSDQAITQILSPIKSVDFIGRTLDLEAVLRHAKGETKYKGLALMSASGLGLSELLRQTYDYLFQTQDEIIPFYFQFKKSDKTPRQMAGRFLQEFLQQIVAFRLSDPKLLDASCDICEIAELAIPSDGKWMDRLIENCSAESVLNDDNSFIRQSLSAPLRAASSGANLFVMIDDMDKAEHLTEGLDLIEELKGVYKRSKVRFVFAGKRRFLFNALQTGDSKLDEIQMMELSKLSFEDCGLLAENLAVNHNLNITDQTRDLITQQFHRNTGLIRNVFRVANEAKRNLDTFQLVETNYSEALFGGRIKGFYDSIFDEIIPDVEVQKQFISLI